MKKYFILIVLSAMTILSIVMAIGNTKWGKQYQNDKLLEEFYELQISDLLDSASYHKADHNTPKLFFHSGKQVDLFWLNNQEQILDACRSGDSIYKRKGTLTLKIISHGEMRHIQMDVTLLD